MLLFCDRIGIALEFNFRVAGENIRVLQISGKSGRALGTAFRTVPRACSLANSDSNLREYWDGRWFQRPRFAMCTCEQKSYQMNKCLSLVHLTAEFLSRETYCCRAAATI